ncbi:MAG: long-chain-fatty-acid--CoA ligase [Jatrophihabitans sp.]|nr:MAG: long-chain-fatty-acid--CoA ligase [Jatrophihabitans sp.]
MDATLPDPVFLDERLAHWAAVDPDGEALTYLDRTWTWGQWNERVRRLAGALHELGIGRGDVVGSLDKNHPATVELTFAAASLGAATAIFNWRLAGDEVDYAVNDSGARVLVVGTGLLPLVGKLRDRIPRVEQVVEVTPDGGDGDAYEALLASATPRGRSAETTPQDVCVVMYSSGTTGRPKGVMLTQANLIAHTLNAHEGWGFEPGDKNMVAMPLFHVGGTSYIQFGVHDGVPTVMTREADGASLAAAIMAGANRTFLVPAVLAQVLQAGPQAIALFGRLRTYCYGASPMPLPLLRRAIAAWPDTEFIQVYGMTEVGGVITHLMPAEHRDPDHPERLASAGKLIPGAELRVVDPVTGEDVPPGGHGELWFRSPQVMKGFLNKADETAATVTADGWLRSGDLGRVDADGYVYVEDRLKDMIISGGENIYSPEIERVLNEHPAVAEAAIIGVPDERWGEAVKAVITLHSGREVGESELIDYCAAHLARYKCPRSVDVVAEFPRNPTGKILKRELRRPYWEGRQTV